ncbi:DNA-binding domain-containing protein, AraC-type [Opitutaceae bacterium TAV1]|nr:AraC family transcriptional regulator [Opitutaceae bacterium TAV5]EIQ01815.1 DNA-binding domain-containing protein, AraC-type [Opitutaceae bacterium TAV1]
MGYAVHSVEGLGSPFLLVDEMVFVIPRGGEVRLARHHFKFLFILGGEFEHEIEGVEGRRKLGPGDILVAPLVERHCYVNPHPRKAAQAHVVRLFLDGVFLKKRAARRTRKPETDFADFVIHHFPQVVQLPGGIDNEITELVTALRRETEERAAGFRHRVRSICTDLIVAVARRAGAATGTSTKAAAPAAGHAGATIVAAAKEYVLKHLAEDMALGEIAWHVGRGEEHLARVFKRETGRSVFDYVREMRINEAKTHLLDPALTLTVIAERCGFHSLSFFSRTFRQHVGMSPSAYRQHAQAELRPMVRR